MNQRSHEWIRGVVQILSGSSKGAVDLQKMIEGVLLVHKRRKSVRKRGLYEIA